MHMCIAFKFQTLVRKHICCYEVPLCDTGAFVFIKLLIFKYDNLTPKNNINCSITKDAQYNMFSK